MKQKKVLSLLSILSCFVHDNKHMMVMGDGHICDPVGIFDVTFYCEDGSGIIGPFNQIHEISDRGDGFINFYTYLPITPPLEFNFTMIPMPGEDNIYEGGVTWLSYYPGDGNFFAESNIPPLIPARLEFDEDCNYWTDWMTQRPGFGRGGAEENTAFTPPTHPCHTQGIRRGFEGEPRTPYEDVNVEEFLGTYNALVKCYAQDREIDTIEEEHTIYLTEASEAPFPFYGMRRERVDSEYVAIDVLSHDGYNNNLFHGGTQNISGYNMEEDDVAWFDVNLVPLVEYELYFSDDFESYDAVLIGQRPGLRTEDDPLGVHVCRIKASKNGLPSDDWEPVADCNPSGNYDGERDCRKYRYDIGEFEERYMIEDLGNGFYRNTERRRTEMGTLSGEYDNHYMSQSILTEDPTKPGYLTGSVYASSDYTVRDWSIVDYPIYRVQQMQMEDDCQSFTSSQHSYRPGFMPSDDCDGDVVFMCRGSGEYTGPVIPPPTMPPPPNNGGSILGTIDDMVALMSDMVGVLPQMLDTVMAILMGGQRVYQDLQQN